MSVVARSVFATGTSVVISMILLCQSGFGIPAFARKYGLRCSACHEAWPKLNNFGQVFKDNGYQLDHVFTDGVTGEAVKDCWIDERAAVDPRLSDHAPLIVDFEAS